VGDKGSISALGVTFIPPPSSRVVHVYSVRVVVRIKNALYRIGSGMVV